MNEKELLHISFDYLKGLFVEAQKQDLNKGDIDHIILYLCIVALAHLTLLWVNRALLVIGSFSKIRVV